MAFDNDDLSLVGAATGDMPAIYSYFTEDSLTTVLADDYFAEKKLQFKVSDIIYINTSDGVNIINIQTINGVTTTSTLSRPANEVIVNAKTDLPTASSGIIQLVDGKNYVFGASFSLGTDRIVLGANNTITANNVFSPVLSYSGTGTMITGVDVNVTLSLMSFDCPNGEFINLSAPTNALVRNVIESITILSCAKAGTFNNLRALDIINVGFFNSDDGFTILGNTQWLIFSLTKLAIVSTNASFIGIDLGTSLQSTVEMTSLFLIGPAGAVGISGAAANANISANNIATVIESTIAGGLTPLSGIDSDDIRWAFENNSGITNSMSDALLGFNNNATETVISTINTPVVVNATWVLESARRLTTTTGGRATYKGELLAHFPVDVSIGLVAAGGGTKDVTVYLCLNGSIITNTGRTIEVAGSKPRTLSIPWQLDLAEDDYLEVCVENNTDTVNIVVENCILRIN